MDYTNSEIAAIIADRIHSERDRRIMRMKLIDGMTYERIAEEVEMSPHQVYRLVKKYRSMIKPEQEIFTEICFS